MSAFILVVAALLPRIYVADEAAPAFRGRGVEVVAPAEVNGREKVPAPALEMHTDVATATSVPWIDSNAWRFLRGSNKVVYDKLPAGSAALAAAEAYAFGVDAVLEPTPQDAEALARMLAFIKRIDEPAMPALANIGLIDDGSEQMAEVMNLMSRRNLLYRVVKEEDPSLPVNVRVGSAEYPQSEIGDPNYFAARLRARVGDDNRLVRLYGSYTVLVHLTGRGDRERLHLINYGRRPATDLRVRVLGAFVSVRLAEFGDPKRTATDIAVENGGTEFTIPSLTTYAVVDLEKKGKK